MAAERGMAPASTIFVGNLAYEVSEQQLIDYFSQVGPVKNIRIVTERETGKPRGFGFIEFYDIPTAESAIRNLNGSELMGRPMRIVFAEGGPPGAGGPDFRPRPRDDDRSFGDDRRRPPPPRTRVVGADLAYHASHGMAALLGQPAQPGAPADSITTTLARKTRSELWEYLAQMKSLVQQNPAQARQILVQNPQLTKALFQMEVILGLVANPLGDVAPKGVAPPDMLAPRGPGVPPPQQALPVVGIMEQPSMQPQPLMQQPGMMQPQALMQQGPMQPQQPMQQLAPPGAPNGMPMAMPGYGVQPPAQFMPQEPPPGMAPAYIMAHPAAGPQPVPGYAPMAPQPAPAPVDPRMAAAAAGPVDPRARAGASMGGGLPMGGSGQMLPMAGTAPPQQQPQPMPAAAQPAQQPPQQAQAAGQSMTPEMQQALLQQVMSLTPQQIELLPPQQKAQVLALQQQMRGGQAPM